MATHFTVMGSGSEQLLARVINAMRDTREAEGDPFFPPTEKLERRQVLADVLNEAEDYLMENEQFVARLAARGDMS